MHCTAPEESHQLQPTRLQLQDCTEKNYYDYYQQCASMLKCECVPSDACMLVIICTGTVAVYSDLSAFLLGMAALVPWRRA